MFWVMVAVLSTRSATRFSRLLRTMSVTISVVSTSRSSGEAAFLRSSSSISPSSPYCSARYVSVVTFQSIRLYWLRGARLESGASSRDLS